MQSQHGDSKSLQAAVIGVGSLGQHHARVYTEIPGVSLVGVADKNEKQVKDVAKRCRCPAYTDYHELLNQIDIASIVVNTQAHYAVAKECLKKGISILLEKPMTTTLAEADDLIRIAKEKKVVLQIGHIERFNRAIEELKTMLTAPKFIEVHRLGPFSQRNMDIGVTLDLMIHDLDIILDLVGSKVKRVQATGVKILSEHDDISNARITFANSCVANVSASRVTMAAQRKIRIFSPASYISIDYKKQELSIYTLKKGQKLDEHNLMKMIKRERKVFDKKEPLKSELTSFVNSVCAGQPAVVSGEHGRQALALALEISEQIKRQNYSAK
ncbi:Gfo/Idh/MocA family oxidoreductase [bacterium]|nr:Gfo/Idh/MocA family oxidoreductase [bacterium]